MKQLMNDWIKLLFGIFISIIGIYMFSRGFYMLNSTAADLCFGAGTIIILIGFVLWTN